MFHIFPADLLAAKMSKGNPTAPCTNEHKILKTEPQTDQNTVEDDTQMVVVKTPQSTACKPQTLKEEEKLLEGHLETPEEIKKEDEKMENEPCEEASSTSSEKNVKGKVNVICCIFVNGYLVYLEHSIYLY